MERGVFNQQNTFEEKLRNYDPMSCGTKRKIRDFSLSNAPSLRATRNNTPGRLTTSKIPLLGGSYSVRNTLANQMYGQKSFLSQKPSTCKSVYAFNHDNSFTALKVKAPLFGKDILAPNTKELLQNVSIKLAFIK
jgi:hypothetical protein